MAATIFLSHIHEEAELAQMIQKSIEDEFSGFVEVFVSSDGNTIPVGTNLLKKIEIGLVSCVGAIYLISPISLIRNWINFELGAVWVRNVLSIESSEIEIPICHSGIVPRDLPMPLINLNAINGNSATELQFAFKSIQIAVGGKGQLKTDFAILAKQIFDFEKRYTVGSKFVSLFNLLEFTTQTLVGLFNEIKRKPDFNPIRIVLGFTEKNVIMELGKLQDVLVDKFVVKHDGIKAYYPKKQGRGIVEGATTEIFIDRNSLLKYELLLKESISKK